MKKQVFVFGSNLSGIHGAGAARFALEKHGARWGQGIGAQGNSYAIPTKDEDIETLPISEVKKHIDTFIEFATAMADIQFNVTAIGCGLAGFQPEDIAPLFANAPKNCIMPNRFKPFLRNVDQYGYWES